MAKRPEDFSGDEIRALGDDLDDRIDLLGDDDEAAAELIEQQSEVGKEISRREALETRVAGGYSAEFNVGGDLIEYESKPATGPTPSRSGKQYRGDRQGNCACHWQAQGI